MSVVGCELVCRGQLPDAGGRGGMHDGGNVSDVDGYHHGACPGCHVSCCSERMPGGWRAVDTDDDHSARHGTLHGRRLGTTDALSSGVRFAGGLEANNEVVTYCVVMKACVLR
jgi:hypothetical protein